MADPMADPMQQDWPDERLRILVPCTLLMVIAQIFLTWRVIYGFKAGRRFLVCDYLLILAQLLNINNVGLIYPNCARGLGRHLMDPSIKKPDDILKYAYLLWVSQITNIIAVAILKWSICAYLLVLNFSKSYRIIIWLSILMITVFNFLIPVLTLFGCTPLESNWNPGITKKKCWARGTLPLSYTQGVSNILTDVVYAVAPIVYLASVQLSKRTQWGLRVVFLLSVIGTVCSIFKTIELKVIVKTMDPTWDGINLTIWSSAELSVGIFIACLPPLRKPFDRVFKKILPSTLTGSHKTPQYGYGYGRSTNRNDIRMSNFGGSRVPKNAHPLESNVSPDDESERAILEDEESGKSGGITRTTKVTVVEESGNGSAEFHKPGGPL
ncbi:hypothetical protein BU24DRAFT_424060 [Aaosphaeria arxii CBS 175.79]|uniref:Rhodopsin domain-containing protein n=1 Tax=Aaosphaeria arxii CBS 175.79 TaxID=1450172 RepID=A0A6A5XQG4_9PLEO|nr:uncharacterized protein BU24DRAFT_424060 [Aaosphaeria arxii CBS 175.79]KAF2015173.1 hypothetical protein BU24DRAFT_424060 [Aaosphaeria arxii CBS 175.79]